MPQSFLECIENVSSIQAFTLVLLPTYTLHSIVFVEILVLSNVTITRTIEMIFCRVVQSLLTQSMRLEKVVFVIDHTIIETLNFFIS